MEYLAIDSAVVVQYTANFLANKIFASAVDTDLPIVVGVSGGNSPYNLYQTLTQSVLKDRDIIERLVFVQVDERIVEPSHKDSNQKMIYETLGPLFDKGAKFYPMPTDSHDRSAHTVYETLLTALLYKDGYPSVAILGIGEDGHTASIFPDQVDIIPQDEQLVFVTPHEKNGYFRMSLSYTAISTFKSVLFYTPGYNKHKILQEVCKQEHYFVYPAAKILHSHKNSYIIATK